MSLLAGRLLAFVGVCVVWAQTAPAAASLPEARRLYLQGKYSESEELYRQLGPENLAAALGAARCQIAVGRLDEAQAALTAARQQHPQAPTLPAELARLALDRGDYPAAERLAAEALALDAGQYAARWVQAELFRLSGRLEQADRAYEWFVQHYNQEDVSEPETLRLVGLAAAQFARWNRLSDQFRFLANELYPDALEFEANFWPAHYESGRLYLEKYNQADAARELKKALAINPRAAEVHAALAQLALQGYELSDAQQSVDRALEVHPRLLAAHLAQADIHFANFDPRRALETLKGALPLQPLSEETLGRLAAAMLVLDGTGQSGPDSRAGQIMAQVHARNPHSGEFYLALGDALDKLRRFPAAARYYQLAVERLPQHPLARGQWGLMLMRLGEEQPAQKILAESFAADPFNVRVKNTLEVLEVLAGYETLETAHFIIRFDPQHDKILARYAGAWLEEVYPELCRQLGYEPPQKSLFEIFNRARNTSGHGWFSARMVGLPSIHTIGACAGKVVAMQSPNDGQKFNWARVLKHEFVHVLNLQQTDFNIPHWFTEALAVLNEQGPRPQAWSDLLAARLAADSLFTLETINRGFIRPRSSDDWTLAYCQAEIYAEYMLERFGADALSKMLAAYADNLDTPAAIQRSFAVSVADFEQGYRPLVVRAAAGGRAAAPRAAAAPPTSLVALHKAVEADPDNLDLRAALARAHLDRKAYPEARRLIDAILQQQPRHPLASYVRARLHLVVGETEPALQLLAAALDRADPQPDLLALLAGLRLKAEQLPQAAELYELGAARFPADLKWTKSLAAVYLKSDAPDRLAAVLARLADADTDDLVVRKKLAELALAAGDFPAARHRAREAQQIDVQDVDVHRLLAEALVGLGQPAAAAAEFATAVELQPDSAPLHLALARAALAAGQPERARAALDALRKIDPQHPGAADLEQQLP
jgi:tetratricopeptide (TPR) repeat protein